MQRKEANSQQQQRAALQQRPPCVRPTFATSRFPSLPSLPLSLTLTVSLRESPQLLVGRLPADTELPPPLSSAFGREPREERRERETRRGEYVQKDAWENRREGKARETKGEKVACTADTNKKEVANTCASQVCSTKNVSASSVVQARLSLERCAHGRKGTTS